MLIYNSQKMLDSGHWKSSSLSRHIVLSTSLPNVKEKTASFIPETTS